MLELNQVWAARLELKPQVGTTEYARGIRGAFVVVLVACDSESEYMKAAMTHLDEEGFKIVATEDLAPLSEGLFEMNDMMLGLLNALATYPVQWSTFHLFSE